MSSKTEIATRGEKSEIAFGEGGLVLRTMTDVYRFCVCVVKSRIAPRDTTSPEIALIKVQSGAEVGLSPWQSIQSIAVINGRPTMWGDACIALVLGSGKLEWMDTWAEGDGENCVVYFKAKRIGIAKEVVAKFGWQDAKRAGLLSKDTYKSYPTRMFFNRARAFVLRDLFADVLKGISVREEVEDYAVADDTPRPASRARKSNLLAEPEPEPSEVIDVEPEPEPEDDYDDSVPPQPADEGEVPEENPGLNIFDLKDLLASDADNAVIQAEIDRSRRSGMITQSDADGLELALGNRKPANKSKGKDALFETDEQAAYG